jgi:iron complex outermembrane recepter protein
MLMKKIIPAILYLFVMPQAFSGDKSDLVTGTITVKDSFVDSRIMKFPATVETYDKKQIEESVNAATPAQTLKYLPSIQVRERSIGDRNGIISSRTIGSISSAQSMLYADGVLLSNLLGNSFSYPPRWGMVNPEEIQRISMMYGPFSSLYAGNSMGGVINIETRMPERLEAHAGVQSFIQNFKLYGTDQTKIGNREFFSIGNKVNDFSFWASMNRLENTAQPLDFSVNDAGSGTLTNALDTITGAYRDKGIKNQDRIIFGATAIDTSIQTNGKFKGQYEFSNQSKLTYTIGLWDLDSRQNVQSYIKDKLGNSIYGGNVILGGKTYSVSRMNPAQAEAFHVMQSIDFKSNDKGFFNWQMTLSDYDYSKDLSNRSNLTGPSNTNPYITKTGQITDLSGTGWTVFDSRFTLRPKDHTIDLGYHLDYYHLRQTVNVSNDWMGSQKGVFTSLSSGNTKTHAVYVQDKWQISPEWALTLGGRQEHYEAYDGVNQNNKPSTARYEDRSRNKFSPKVSLSFEPIPAWGFRAAFGKAYRFPTVTELFQQLIPDGCRSGCSIVENNPNLKPEEIYSSEITAERRFVNGLARASFFREDRYDALISQTNLSSVGGSTSYVQNIDHVRIHGIELATELKNVMIPKLDLVANATLTDSEILKNDAAPSYINKKVPRIPRQLYKAVATYRVSEDFTMSLAARYSGRQFINLENSDINPETYAGASRLLFVDAKVNYKFKDRWTASLGVDNIFNDQAYVSHPLSQRTGYAQIKFDY